MNNINIALFIDYENLKYDSENIDVSIVVNELKKRGRIIHKKAYGDWVRFRKDRKTMLENSIDLIELPSHKQSKKNGADIRLVVDALETAFTKKHIDTIAILSGDSDFTSLISKLREYNKYVISIGKDKKSTSTLIEKYSDEILYYSDLLNSKASKETLKAAFELMIKAIRMFDTSKVYSYHIKEKMIELDPDFNEKRLGFPRFHTFLDSAEIKKIIKLTKASRKPGYMVTLLSVKKTGEKSHSKETENKEDDKVLEILDDLYWSITLADQTLTQPFSINPISKNLRVFIPNFKISNYGVSKNQGLTFLLEKIQKLGYIRLSTIKKTLHISPQKKLIEYGKTLQKPIRFDEILGERCIKNYRLDYKLSDLLKAQPVLRSILSFLDKTAISITHLYRKYCEELQELNESFSARRTFHILLQTNNLITERGKEASELDWENIIDTQSFSILDEEGYNAFFEENLKNIALKEDIHYDILLNIYRKINDLDQRK